MGMGFRLFGSALALGAAGAAAASMVLFNRTIPRQEQLRVDVSEFADMTQWEEYGKKMMPMKEWFNAQEMEEIDITARDGVKLHAYYLPAEQPSDKLVIGCHGYTSCGRNDFPTHTKFFHEQGFDMLILDLRAHGKSGGDYVGFGILDRFDCLAWIHYVEKRFEKKKRILLHGTSMGGATVLMTSGFAEIRESVKGIIADCAFTSPQDIFVHILKKNYHLPAFPIMDMNNATCRRKAGYGFDDYSTLTALKSNTIPVLFIHGKEDKFVPTWMTQKNYDAATCEKELLWVENAGHGASLYENTELYEKTELQFIKKYFA